MGEQPWKAWVLASVGLEGKQVLGGKVVEFIWFVLLGFFFFPFKKCLRTSKSCSEIYFVKGQPCLPESAPFSFFVLLSNLLLHMLRST